MCGAALAAFAVVGPAGCSPREPRVDRVLLATIDTLRADHVGCYGATGAHTPTLDSIAADGVRFDAAVSPAPITLPAHASLMTGLDPPGHGVRHNSVHRLGAGIPTLAERLRGAGFATAAFVGAVVLDHRFGLSRGFEHYDDVFGGRRATAVGFAERRADRVADAAIAWLRGAPDRFFLWVHFYDPHAAYDPPPGFASAFASRPYAGEIAFADAQLGRVLQAIRARWGPDGLLVVATSDHGESLGAHGEITHSYSLYEPTQRIPLLASGTGLPSGVAVPGVARLVDVAPTVLAAAGAPPLGEVDGIDLHPLIDGRGRERLAYVETLATQIDFGWSPLLGIRSQRFKYIRAPRPELYDLSDDPGETRNLAAARGDVAARLDAELDARLERVRRAPGADFLSPADRERLRSLGYVSPAATPDERALGVVGGPDPKDHFHLLREIGEAEARIGEGKPRLALERLLALDPVPAVLALRAAASLTLGDVDAAASAAREALAASPGRLDLWLLLGRALEARGDAAAAGDAYAKAAELAPEAADAWIGRGRTLEALGRFDEAERSYARASGLEASWRRGALLLGRLGRPDEALVAIDRALSLSPDPEAEAALAYLRAEALAATGRVAESRESAARAIEGAAGRDVAWRGRAEVLLRGGPERPADPRSPVPDPPAPDPASPDAVEPNQR